MTLRLALVGRPNVGKSTLFNRFVGKRLAIVHDTPGVTRDWKEAPGRLGDLSFVAVDTAGIENAAKDNILSGMKRQTEAALKQADVVLFVVDGREGVTAQDRAIAGLLRKLGRPVVLAANKCEGRKDLSDLFGLGFGDPCAISAAHGEGMADLYAALAPHFPEDDTEDESDADADENAPIRLALVGRPNVGKSTLLNALLGDDRALVSPLAGTTRDAIAARWTWRGRDFRLVDTAGLRRKSRIDDTLEKLATAETLRVIRLAEIVVLVLDANSALEQQDLTIADLVLREGRALVIALNKWDTIREPGKLLRAVEEKITESLQQGRGMALVPVSALKGRRLDTLMETVLATYARWDTRLTTGPLNRWLEAMLDSHPPPLVDGKRVKIRYITQRKARPPTFALFCGSHALPPESYLRYLSNGLRERFELPGVPVRMEARSGKNPYAED